MPLPSRARPPAPEPDPEPVAVQHAAPIGVGHQDVEATVESLDELLAPPTRTGTKRREPEPEPDPDAVFVVKDAETAPPERKKAKKNKEPKK